MATMRVIGRDASLTIYDGGAVDSDPDFDTPVVVDTLCREIRISEEIGEIDVAAFGDATKRFRPDQSEWTIEFDMVVETTGLVDIAIGNYVKAETKAYSGFVASVDYEGILRNLEVVSRMGDICVQRMTLRGPADMTA